MNQKEKRSKLTHSLPIIILLVIIILILLEFILFYLNRETAVPPGWSSAGGTRQDAASLFDVLLSELLALLSAVFGVLILRRGVVPRIGALFLAIGVMTVMNGVLTEITIYTNFTAATLLPVAGLAAWLVNFFWTFLFMLGFYLLAIFPNGRYLSRRWRNLMRIVLIIPFSLLCINAMIENPLQSAFQIPNPYFSGPPAWLSSILYGLGLVGLLVAVVLVSLAVLQRFRLSYGREKQQLKWLFAGAAMMVLVAVSGSILAFGWGMTIGEIMIGTILLWPIIGIGVAMVRHQLYDIDLIIRRTLVYGFLTITLGIIYLVSVILLQRVLSLLVTADSPLAIVLSTLLIAALFNPLRRRLQGIIDRRFYRQKYDAQQVLEQFASMARDETDMQLLTAELRQVIQETMQPEMTSLWLKR